MTYLSPIQTVLGKAQPKLVFKCLNYWWVVELVNNRLISPKSKHIKISVKENEATDPFLRIMTDHKKVVILS